MLEQEYDTIEETYEKMSQDEVVLIFKNKEIKHRNIYYKSLILMTFLELSAQITNALHLSNISYILEILCPSVMIFVLSVSFFRIRKYFLKYHRDKF